MSSKKLRVTTLAGVFILVVVFIFVLINITSSSAFARSPKDQSQPINRTVYRVTAGGGDAALVNMQNQDCRIITSKKLKIGTIVAIDQNAPIKKCSNEDGSEIELPKLSEREEYVAINNLTKRMAGEAFNENNQAQVSSSNGLNIRGEDCKLLNETDKSIPKALPNRALVTLRDPDNVKTITCNIPVDRILYTFEMVEVEFQYKKGKENVTATGYVAQENLKIPDNTGRKIIIIQ